MDLPEMTELVKKLETAFVTKFGPLSETPRVVKESTMEGIMDKLNINVGDTSPGHHGGDGGAGLAAVIAALGNRNQENLGPALIAALGNRNEGDPNLGPLLGMLASKGHHDGGSSQWNSGFWIFGLIALLALLRGNLFGRDGGDGGAGRGGVGLAELLALNGGAGAPNNVAQVTFDQTILQMLNGLTSAVPQTALQTQNALQGALAQLALAGQQGFSGVKDTVQNLSLYLSNQLNNINQNVSDQGCQTREMVEAGTCRVINTIKDSTIANLQAELAEARSDGRARVNELSITQSVNQTQAQSQQQQQIQAILPLLNQLVFGMGNLTQIAHATNSNVIAGNSAAVTTGAQTANPTNVRA